MTVSCTISIPYVIETPDEIIEIFVPVECSSNGDVEPNVHLTEDEKIRRDYALDEIEDFDETEWENRREWA